VFLPSDAAIEKLKAAGILAAVQDHPVLLGHNQRRWWGEQRAAASIPIRKLIDAGLLVGGGTDGPVVPVDPFLSMWWMTTRQTLAGDVLGAEHAITAEEALLLYTLNNARILGVDGERGSIETGKHADLAILSQDILSIDPHRIRDTRALLTMVGGRIVYRAPDFT
jgi:predicted amidohydrolase YtcJ